MSIPVTRRSRVGMHELRQIRAATSHDTSLEMPFGVDSRVIALARERGQNSSAIIALLARRAAVLAIAIIVILAAGVYRLSNSTNDLLIEYTMADNAIESNLG